MAMWYRQLSWGRRLRWHWSMCGYDGRSEKWSPDRRHAQTAADSHLRRLAWCPHCCRRPFLFVEHCGFGPKNPELSAQGAALAEVTEQPKPRAAPVDKYGSGAAVGLGLGLFPIAGLGVLVGLAFALPITLTYGLGCLTAIWLEKGKGKLDWG